ncbi:hypothetical protein L3X38_041108 [Prunus dulcis]|uniref:Uncharacterized protein n=1 Tax=Prunus dulcis TaxID=3755 RepID=A0AAD4YK27_PRUDU|nr:hypothetical protein L3X38_041108 [Prunus dulcis]
MATPLYMRWRRSGNLEAAVLLVDLDNNVRGDLADVSYEGVLEIRNHAVIGQNFETALWLLKEYPDLADRKESNGLTSLQLLAQMPSASKPNFAKAYGRCSFINAFFNDDNIDRIPPNDLGEQDQISLANSSCSKKITKFRSPGSRMMLEKMQNENSLLELTYLLIEKGLFMDDIKGR